MLKRLTTAVTMTIVIAGASLVTISMAAQGRGQGGPPAGVGGGLGAHSCLGLPGSNGHGAAHPAAAAPLGPMSPTTQLQQNSKLASKLASFFPPNTDLLAE